MGAHPREADKVVVTGFGPFGVHKVNSSWLAVQELSKLGLKDPFAELVTEEIKVDYEYVKDRIPRLWTQNNPLLMIHVGVAGMANAIRLERCGHNSGYMKLDVSGKCPVSGCCIEGFVPSQKTCIATSLDLEKVSKIFDENHDIPAKNECDDIQDSPKNPLKTRIEISDNAGRYLCEFIYYSSLHIDASRCLFIHVPDLEVYSAEQLGAALKIIVDALVDQIRNRDL